MIDYLISIFYLHVLSLLVIFSNEEHRFKLLSLYKNIKFNNKKCSNNILKTPKNKKVSTVSYRFCTCHNNVFFILKIVDNNEGESDRKAGRKFLNKNDTNFYDFTVTHFTDMKRDNSELTTKDVNVNVPPECKVQLL